MIFEEVSVRHLSAFNKLSSHPLQSWEWGEFRKKTGIKVLRIGKFNKGILQEAIQLTLHMLPMGMGNVGYIAKSKIPSKELHSEILRIAKNNSCIFVKFEPNVIKNSAALEKIKRLDMKKSPHPLFTPYTFHLNLDISEEQLLKNMHHKTRYNIKIAQKNNVEIHEETSKDAFDAYLDLTFKTAKRQGFFAHTREYHKKMWEVLKSAGIAHLLCARYKTGTTTKVLASWILFLFHDTLYYPYGASSNECRNTMASNLLMWETILFGKYKGVKNYDMWGSLGPNPDPKDPWYGFHRFKQGYSPQLVEFIGSFDAVINTNAYTIYNSLYHFRRAFLSFKRLLT